MQEEARHGLSLLDYANGVIVKAGEWPSLGWVEHDPYPAPYVAANRILKPVRATRINGMHMGSIMGETRFTEETSNLWLRRFDAPGIWPQRPSGSKPVGAEKPVTETEPEILPPSLPPEARWLRAYPGKPCPVSGDWFNPFMGKTVCMVKGEPMPGPETVQQGDVIWYMREK